MEMMHHTAATPIDRCTRLVVTPHPLTLHGQTSVAVMMADGESLASVLYSAGVDDAWIVELDGFQVPAMMWGRTRVKHGVVIECRRAVHDNDTLRVVAFATLAYFTMGGGAAGVFGTGLTGSLVGAAAFYAGSQVINRVLPPAQAGQMSVESNNALPTYSLSGGRNSARLWEPMSLVLGQPYVVPDLAGQPWSYFSGEDQYLNQIFHGGINLQRIDSLRIGQTDIGSYQGVTLRAKGLPESAWGSDLPANSVDTVAGALLDAPSGTGAWVTRTTSPNTLNIGIDLEMSLYKVNASSGAWESDSVTLNIEYAVAGSGNWVGLNTGASYQEQYQSGTEIKYVFDEGTGQFNQISKPIYSWRTVPYAEGTATYSNASSKPLRVGINLPVALGQYDVRIRKVTANTTATSAQNVVTWTQLKSFQPDLTSYPGQSLVALTIKASGQLSGSLDQLNWVATARPAPYWNGSAWVTATNKTNGLSNPGVQLLQLARGIYDEHSKLIAGLGWADSRIDIESIKSFMMWCAAKQFRFDAIIQQTMSIGDLMDAIAYAGMGSISWSSGKLGVQWLADDAPIEGVINMGNIKARSFSVGYAANDRADEIEYGYFDEGANHQWNSLRVQSPAVTTPTNTARLSNMGVTSEAHAAVLARYAMAQNIYMAKSITFDQDLEFLTYKRGTVLALSHDMTQWGYSGRIQSAVNSSGVITLTLDDTIPAPTSGSAYIGLRLVGESQYRIFTCSSFTGSTRSVTLAGAWPSGVALPGANGQPMDALWIYDFKATPGQKVVVSKIEPADNQGGARLTVTPLPDEFWPYVLNGTYTPPPNRSLLRNKVPNCTSALVREVLKRQGNTYSTELTVQFELSGPAHAVQIWGSTGGADLVLMGTTTGLSYTWAGGLSENWNIEVRPYNLLGMFGASKRVSYTAKGLSVPPPDVTQFKVNNAALNWKPVDAVDLAGYKIRFQYGQNNFWGNATALHNGLITEMPYDMVTRPSGVVTLLIKAVDTSGNESENASAITLNLGDTLVDNVLLDWPQHTAWLGSKTNCSVSSGWLLANLTDLFYGQDDALFYGQDAAAFYEATYCAPSSYEFELTTAATGTLKLQHDISATSYSIEYQRGNQSPFYGLDLDFIYGQDADLFYGENTEWLTWPGQLEITGSETIAFKVSMTGGAGQDTIKTLTALLDVPDILIYVDDIYVGLDGARLPLGSTVNYVKNVQVTVQSDGGNAIAAIVSDKQNALGPFVQVFDKNLNAHTGVVDAVIQAY